MKASRLLPAAVLLFAAASPPTIKADGCYASSDYLGALSSDQRAIIILEDKRTTTVYSTAYTGEGSEFGWIIPVPGLPESGDVFEPVDGEWLLELLDEETQPDWTSKGIKSGGIGPGIGGVTESADSGEVSVYEVVTLNNYEVSILGASTGSSLISWLDGNGYSIREESEDILNAYISEGWNFAAVKIRPAQKRYYEGEFLPPLAIRHAIPRAWPEAVFPMRISGVSTVAKVRVSLYVVGQSTFTSTNYDTVNLSQDPKDRSARKTREYLEHLIEAALGDRDRGLVKMWAGECPPEIMDHLLSAQLVEYPLPGYLTRLETLIQPTMTTPDIHLLGDDVFRPFRITLRYRSDPEDIFRTLLAVLFLLLILLPPLLRITSLAIGLIAVPVMTGLSAGRDEDAIVLLSHRSGYMGFAGPLLVLLVRGKSHPVIKEHCRRVLNFQLSMILYFAIPIIVMATLELLDNRGIVEFHYQFFEVAYILLIIYYWIQMGLAFFITLNGVSKAKKKEASRYILSIPFLRAEYRS